MAMASTATAARVQSCHAPKWANAVLAATATSGGPKTQTAPRRNPRADAVTTTSAPAGRFRVSGTDIGGTRKATPHRPLHPGQCRASKRTTPEPLARPCSTTPLRWRVSGVAAAHRGVRASRVGLGPRPDCGRGRRRTVKPCSGTRGAGCGTAPLRVRWTCDRRWRRCGVPWRRALPRRR